MNIFILHENPQVAATMHCDQHLNKMILESAQMLSTALHTATPLTTEEAANIYKSAYLNHPCTQWTRASYANFVWVIDLVYSLQAQLPKLHDSYKVVRQCELLGRKYRNSFPPQDLTPFVVAGDDDIKARSDLTVVQKYHEIYRRKALLWAMEGRLMSYSQFGHRPIPEFIRPALLKAEERLTKRQGRTNRNLNNVTK